MSPTGRGTASGRRRRFRERGRPYGRAVGDENGDCLCRLYRWRGERPCGKQPVDAWGARNLISTQVSGVSVAMGDALQPGDLLVTIKEASTTEADEPEEALAA